MILVCRTVYRRNKKVGWVSLWTPCLSLTHWHWNAKRIYFHTNGSICDTKTSEIFL